MWDFLVIQWLRLHTPNGGNKRSGLIPDQATRFHMVQLKILEVPSFPANRFISTFFFSFIFISWRLLTLQYCSGFCHTLTWINHGFTCAPHPNPPFLPIPSLWVIPVHQPWALVSCIQPGLVICFTLDNIHVSMLFSQIIPASPSPTESKSLFYTSVSLFLSCI